MTETCAGCLYLSQGSNYNYCMMRNLMIDDVNKPICDKWKHKPKKKAKEKENYEWVQMEINVDGIRSMKK